MADTPTPEMVERVARAICLNRGGQCDCHDAGSCFALSEHLLTESNPTFHQARAAIKAMLEPTEVMVAAAAPAHEGERIMHKVAYRLMIDAALSETPMPEGLPTGDTIFGGDGQKTDTSK